MNHRLTDLSTAVVLSLLAGCASQKAASPVEPIRLSPAPAAAPATPAPAPAAAPKVESVPVAATNLVAAPVASTNAPAAPAAPPAAPNVTVTTNRVEFTLYKVQPGDTLSQLAEKQLGGASRWPEIVALNPGLTPEKLRAGSKIRIPAVTTP